MLCGIKLGLIIIIMIINDYDDDINNNITGMAFINKSINQ